MSDYSRLIHETKPKARKEYHCDAWELISNDIGNGHDLESKLTPEEKQAWEKAENENGRILKGTIYLNQVLEYDGDLYTFRARPEIWEICIKYRIGFEEY